MADKKPKRKERMREMLESNTRRSVEDLCKVGSQIENISIRWDYVHETELST